MSWEQHKISSIIETEKEEEEESESGNYNLAIYRFFITPHFLEKRWYVLGLILKLVMKSIERH